MTHIIGTVLLWIIAAIMVLVGPFCLFAVSMATNPTRADFPRGGCFVSLFGLGLMALLIWGPK